MSRSPRTLPTAVAGGLKNVLVTAIEGGDISQAFSDLFAGLADMFLNMAFEQVAQMLADTITDSLTKGIDTAQQAAIAAQQVSASTVMQTAATQQVTAAAQMLTAAQIMAASGGLPGRADGGPVIGSKPYVVGERGPELFVPAESGTIIPMTTWNRPCRSTRQGLKAVRWWAQKVVVRKAVLGCMDAPMEINISGGVMQFGGDDYVTKDQVQEIVAQASKRRGPQPCAGCR